VARDLQRGVNVSLPSGRANASNLLGLPANAPTKLWCPRTVGKNLEEETEMISRKGICQHRKGMQMNMI